MLWLAPLAAKSTDFVGEKRENRLKSAAPLATTRITLLEPFRKYFHCDSRYTPF